MLEFRSVNIYHQFPPKVRMSTYICMYAHNSFAGVFLYAILVNGGNSQRSKKIVFSLKLAV